MVAIKDEDKVEIGQFFSEGIHKVKIAGTSLEDAGSDKEYLDIGLVGEGGESTDKRLYFSEKALKYSINTIRAIMVHNAPEDKKNTVRDEVNKCQDTEELAKLCAEKMDGMECWLSLWKNGKQYTATDGTIKDSFDKNIYGYEPKPPKNIAVAQNTAALMGGGEITKDNMDEFPFP